MFMVKDECANIKNLFKVKMKISEKNLKWFLFVVGIMFSRTLIPVLSILQEKDIGVIPHNMSDYSISFFFGIVIAYLIFIISYRQMNDILSVLPQTNNSRFIATQLLNYVFAVFVGLVALLMYLLNYGILKFISLRKENIYFALNFDVGFIITGFLTFLVYSFLVIAVFGLIGAIIRKWRYYAIVALVSLFSLMIANLQWVFENLPQKLAFIINEPVPAWFMLKGILLWLVITAVSLVINYYTIYYKSQRKTTSVGIAVICGIAVVISMIVPALLLFNTSSRRSTAIEIHAELMEDYNNEFTEIRIDISHLPKGSKLNIESELVSFPELNISHESNKHKFIAFGTEALSDLQGNTLIVSYRMPKRQVNGIELYDYGNHELTAYLSGDTLHIDYNFEDTHVIILPIWGIAGQFDCYKDKGVLPETIWGYSSGGRSEGDINIRVE